MPRPKRILYPDACYHVFNRGISKKTIFFSDAHKCFFTLILEEMVQEMGVEILAYCMMSNHYHILIKTPHGNLDKAMHYFGHRFSVQINRDLNADGPLFKDRYKALLVDTESYLLQVSRYIHLNPVEANLVSAPEDYPWSSYLDYIGHRNSDTSRFLNTDMILSYFKNRSGYDYFVSQGIDQDTRNFYSKKKKVSIFGSEKFIARIRHLKS